MRNKIIEIAARYVGTTENPPNTNKTVFGQWFGLDGVPWCGIFVSFVYYLAGFPLKKVGFSKGFAGCQTAVAYYKKMNYLTDTPKTGDIVFFDFNGDGRYDHTGIFVKWINDKVFETIEGNTSLSNNTNGGEVMVRERNKKNCIFVNVLQD